MSPGVWFESLHPVFQALVAALFTWTVTALGAAVVFFAKDVSRRVLDTALGFTAGVMVAASFWSLLAPSIELAEEMGSVPWVPALVGFLAGGVFLLRDSKAGDNQLVERIRAALA